MALFKSFMGLKKNLPVQLTDGYLYWTRDDRELYLDSKDSGDEVVRTHVNRLHIPASQISAEQPKDQVTNDVWLEIIV